ncbi:DNA cytosine methyltransferase [Pontibacter burrus]|uniref:DNA (cytosine-5-)-methyltransferase n=1 Tax=Pontibacter burrus TaxID=2704466 RepID=A0A6B3LJN6_9BACT|nr:DNA cytosine methyltransferase [Pontibacter burrus]NEM96183.1 DNA cytosine methyltransferase [Pontibacter burrus]
MKNPLQTPLQYLYVDLFCGAGGVTTGIEKARVNGRKVAKVIACVNHDPIAIRSHAQNHKHVLHFTEDIRTLDLTSLVRLVQFYQAKYPHAKLVLWASLECTNFSKAKGGQPRDADSRTLADHLDRYIEALKPDMIQIENVEEFMAWGPLDANGKPVSRKNGRDFRKWVERIEDYGYSFDYRLLNSADFGAYTSRKRFFAQFARPGVPVSWPKPTHSKTPSSGMFGSLKPWKAVRDVLQLSDEGKSIFGRKKPLVEASLARIYHGLKKHVAPGADAFITKYYSGKPEHKNISVEGPAGTITCVDGQAIVKANFLTKYYGTGVTIPTDSAVSTITTKDRMGLVTAAWLDKNFSSGAHNHQSINEPAGALTTVNKFGLMQACWLDKQFSGTANHQSVDQPAGSILPNDKHCLMQAESWIMPTSYTNVGRSVDEPCPTILASRKHHYLVNPQFCNKGNSVDKPAPTLIAGMGKRPLSLVTVSHVVDADASHLAITENGELAIAIYENDTPWMKQIKELMAELGIVDIKMRMLKVDELKVIQGFPKNYYLAGTQSDQKKFIGNSVPPDLPRAMVESNAVALMELLKEQLIAA